MKQSLERRISFLESQVKTFDDRPFWCSPERRVKRILSVANGREWTCPDLTPEKAAWRDAKLARYEKYYAEMGGA